MLNRSSSPKVPPTQCQRMLHGMEAMLNRVEALERGHRKIKWSHITVILLFISIIVYIVYDGIVGNTQVK